MNEADRRIVNSRNEVKFAADRISSFWEKVDRTRRTECWNWTAAMTCKGYGRFWISGKTFLGAHQVSWILANGLIPRGQCVLHKCDNPGCVNPDHLWLGTKGDNSLDMVSKGRSARGERNSHAQISEQTVQEIRKLFRDGTKQVDLIRRFGISQGHIHKIVRGLRWVHLA